MLAEYNNTVKEYIDEGIVEVVGPDYVMVKKALLIICHIEHLSQKTTVQRKVFDGSTHYENESSINDV